MIRIRQTHDLQLMVEMNQELIGVAMSDEALGKAVWWVAEQDGEPVAYAGLLPQEADGKAFLLRAGVIPAARGLGLQKRLIRVRVAHARKLGLFRVYTYVNASGYASMRSLLSCGFKPYFFTTAEGNYLYFENRPKPAI